VAETYITREKTDVIKVALKTVILSVNAHRMYLSSLKLLNYATSATDMTQHQMVR
jgi:hypothetical protein